MRRLLALVPAALALAGCLKFAPDGIYACDPATMRDCLVCDGGQTQITATGWCRDYAPYALGATVLNTMTGAGPEDVYVAGSDGKVIRWNGARWVDQGLRTAEPFNYAWARNANDVWAVGSGATWAHYDGAGWTLDTITQTSWTGFSSPVAIQSLMAVAGSTSSSYPRVFALDSMGAILYTDDDGASWNLHDVTPTPVVWWGAWRAEDGTSFFVGENGNLLVAPADLSQPMVVGNSAVAPNDLRAVMGTSSSDVWVGGANGMFHWNGTALSAASAPPASIWGMCSPAPGEFFAVGEGGKVLHLPAGSTTWTAVAQPTQEILYAVYCTQTEILIAAESGVVLRRNLPMQ